MAGQATQQDPSRRDFLKAIGAAAAATTLLPSCRQATEPRLDVNEPDTAWNKMRRD